MDWLSLIPAGISLLSGLFGGNKTKDGNSKAIDQATKTILTQAGSIYSKPYQQYTGQRVAAPTASRTAVNPMMTDMTSRITGQMNDSNGLQARAKALLNMGPQRVSVPTMVPGGPQVSMSPPQTVAPLPMQVM